MSLLSRALTTLGFTRAAAVAPSGYDATSISFPSRSPRYLPNWFQLGYDRNANSAMQNSVVYTCVSVIAQEIARMECHVWTRTNRAERRERKHPEIDRLLRRPNSYQTHTDFWMMVISQLLLRGNGVWLRELRDGVDHAWHPIPWDMVQLYITEETGEVFYRFARQKLAPVDPDELVPSRLVGHLRLFCMHHPLIGESPITAAGMSMLQNDAIKFNGANFFKNMARPSGILVAPETLKLTEDVAERVKSKFVEATSGAGMGAPVLLANGYEWKAMTMNASDAQVVEQFRMTVEDIGRVFRLPQHMLGDLSKANYNNVETMQRAFIVQTLGFYLEHIETQLDATLGLGPDEYTEHDVEAAMLRPEFKERMEALARAVQGGVYAPNEARETEHLPAVDGGDTVFLQQQMRPVTNLQAAPLDEPTVPTAETLQEALRRRRKEGLIYG